MEVPRMDRPLPDAAACSRALAALLAMLRPMRRPAVASELRAMSAQLPITQVGPIASAFSASASPPERPYAIVWEFLATRGEERRFEDAYGSSGDWVRLFKQAPGYMGTLLCRDAQNARRYATIDCWTSPDAYQAFRARWHNAYEAIDERCRALTDHEVYVGAFLLPAGVDFRPTP
jgi:heme-degrading monooxygenase HmoA